MGLNKERPRPVFVNIKEGQLYTKKKGGDPEFFESLSGTIVRVDFKKDEYNGKKFEVAMFTMVDGNESFVLQMRTDSGYFRGFSNSLRSGYPDQAFEVSASSVKEGDGRPKTTCFVKQDGLALKWAFTKDNPGDVPALESTVFKGETMWDGTKQIEYWKDWWLSLKFQHALFAGVNDAPPEEEPLSPGAEAAAFYKKPDGVTLPEPANLQEPLDDLPF